MADENFWGIRCKGCGKMHPTAMYRKGDAGGRFGSLEPFRYRCFEDGRLYDYLGSEETLSHLTDSSGE